MSNEAPILSYTSEFKRSLRQLAKRYRQVKNDVTPLLQALAKGGTLGERIQGVNGTLYKVRLKNTDSRKGKRGGYRVIYYLQNEQHIILLTIYSKQEQSDISSGELRQLLDKYLNS